MAVTYGLERRGPRLPVDHQFRSDLVARAQAGDGDAYRALVESLVPSALGAASIITGSRAEAEDAVQEALPSAWLGLRGLRHPEAFAAWFRRQVTRASWRRIRTRTRLVELDAARSTADEHHLSEVLELRQLQRAFGQLSGRDRAILVMHYYWRLPGAETAGLLGIPSGTVKSRVSSALSRLRAAFDADDR